jgi:type I restriction enzyme S subunit
MKLETFFEKFDQFADAPDAVEKMRELVLELAVQGALSERHSSDQDDAAWREFVTRFDQRSCESDTDAEPPFEIPDEWRWACLDDLGTTRVRNDVEDSTRVSFVPMALISSAYGVAAKSEERKWSEIKKGFTHFANGDVVIAKITPCFENAKSAVMRNLINGFGAGTTELHVFRRVTNLILPEFVLLFVKTRGFITRGEPRMTGSAGQKRVPREYLATSPFPLPPLAEQKRIVAKVDELMALCDRLEAQQQDRETRHAVLARASLARFADAPTPANLNFLFHKSYAIPPADLRKFILTLAVQGKIVPQDPKDEPAEELLEKLESERRRFADAHKFRAAIGEPTKDSAAPFAIPPSWKWCRLSSMFNAVTDGDHLPPPKSDDGIAFLTIGNITTGTLDFKGSRFVPDSYYRGLADFRRPVRGDILYTVVGATYGRPALVETDRPFCVQRHIAILKPPQSVDVGFLMAILRSPLAYNQASASTTGTAQPTIPLGSLRNFAAPLPPLAEQRRIVAKVEQLMALVDRLESDIASSRVQASGLLAAAVAELVGKE